MHRNEIDIICEKNGTVTFVEVKSNNTEEFGYPEEAIDKHKIKKISKVAEYYLLKRGLLGKCNSRFDVISIEKNNIKHIEDAFRI